MQHSIVALLKHRPSNQFWSCANTHIYLYKRTHAESIACGNVCTDGPWSTVECSTSDWTCRLIFKEQHRLKKLSARGIKIIFRAIRRKARAKLHNHVEQSRTNSFSQETPHRFVNQDYCDMNPETANSIRYRTSPFQCVRVRPHGSTTAAQHRRKFKESYWYYFH